MKVAVCGFRHGHMGSIVKAVRAHPELEVVAVAEEHPEACRDLLEAGEVEVTHGGLDAMLAEVEFDILAIGDVFARRGSHAIKGLEAGKHILGDKPLCTRLHELDKIRSLAREKGLSVIVALTLRYVDSWRTARRLLHEGVIGDVVTVAMFGHHGLSYRAGRPDWYFEPGLQGGTINDIMIHGIDGIGWLTGHPVVEVLAARAWNAEIPEVPFFQDAAQAFLRLANGAGVIADCSYKAPKGHAAPWVLRFWATGGYMELDSNGGLLVRRPNEPEERITPDEGPAGSLAEDLVAEIKGDDSHEATLTTAGGLESTGKTLRIQAAADSGEGFVAV